MSATKQSKIKILLLISFFILIQYTNAENEPQFFLGYELLKDNFGSSGSKCKDPEVIKGNLSEIQMLNNCTDFSTEYCHIDKGLDKSYKYNYVTEKLELIDGPCPNMVLMPFKICLDSCEFYNTDKDLQDETYKTEILITTPEGYILPIFSYGKFCYIGGCPSALKTPQSDGESLKACTNGLEISEITEGNITLTHQTPYLHRYSSQATSTYFAKHYQEAILYATANTPSQDVFKLVSDQFNFTLFPLNFKDQELDPAKIEEIKDSPFEIKTGEDFLKYLSVPIFDYSNTNCKEISERDENKPLYLAVLTLNNNTASVANETRHLITSLDGTVLAKECSECSYRIERFFNQSYDEHGLPLLDMKIVEELNRQNIDVFDRNLEIFHDKCKPLAIGKSDTTVEIRNKYLLSKIVVCEEGCSKTKDKVDFQVQNITCDCEGRNMSLGFNLPVDDTQEDFDIVDELLDGANIQLFDCYKTAFTSKYLQHNVAFFFNIVFFIIIVLMCFVYCFFYHTGLGKFKRLLCLLYLYIYIY